MCLLPPLPGGVTEQLSQVNKLLFSFLREPDKKPLTPAQTHRRSKSFSAWIQLNKKQRPRNLKRCASRGSRRRGVEWRGAQPPVRSAMSAAVWRRHGKRKGKLCSQTSPRRFFFFFCSGQLIATWRQFEQQLEGGVFTVSSKEAARRSRWMLRHGGEDESPSHAVHVHMDLSR